LDKTYQENYNQRHLNIQKILLERFGVGGLETYIKSDELTVILSKSILIKVINFLKDDKDFQFKQLIDICGVDFPNRVERFEIVYHLLSLSLNQRIRVKLSVKDGDMVPSIVSIYEAANWYEREVWDLYGVIFSDHPDLRRILTDYGFEGHPLRKDFPLSGFTQVKYDDTEKRVVNERVNLVQDFRSFDFESPWEGPEYNDIDEKSSDKEK
jgi:NADH-quinone oxidoreductase subunit C|tara:strand:+ start:104 stop:736 length:633 start_codon:yes stop_codon:yes gene_type:complete